MKQTPIIQLVFATLALAILAPVHLFGQLSGPLENRFETLRQNSTTALDAFGDTLWIAPGMNRIIGSDPAIWVPQNADSVFSGRGRVFSLQAGQDTLVAGLGFNLPLDDGSVQTAMGYYRTLDGGNSWNFIPFPLDGQPPQELCSDGQTGAPCDIEFTYGSQTYIRTRITVPQQSPPFEVDFFGDTILSVNWASGLIRSMDGGDTWERLILPPSSETELVPERTYNWSSQNRTGQPINRYDPRFDNNLLAFGLLIDSQQRVWVGSAAGLNISENVLDAPLEEIRWRRVRFTGATDGLLGNWIVNIREQPGTGTIWMSTWNASNDPADRFGLIATDDGGTTFRQFLPGERVNDIAFFNSRIYVTTDRGLFISDDDGQSWRQLRQIESPNTFIHAGASYFSAAATQNRLWIGTSDGIASTQDGETWSILRVDVPLRGGNIYQPDARNVDTFAYPNPYSPSVHDIVRIKFESSRSGRATLRIFDFGMNRVFTESADLPASGSYEFTWNGLDNSGRFAANGTYIYVIDTPDGRRDGKILLLD
ncbi:MAG: FlgD immunoglobulin-like domain containing protein [Balneolaceae bacterium]